MCAGYEGLWLACFLLHVHASTAASGEMVKRRHRIWIAANGLLALAVLVLLVVLGYRTLGHQAIGSPAKPEPPAAHRIEVNVGRVQAASYDEAGSRMLPDAWSRRGAPPQEWDWLPSSPGMDMAETARGYVLRFSMPGVRDEDIHLTVTDRLVTVQAQLRSASGASVGSILRRVRLPEAAADAGRVDVSFSNGVLHVCVPR